MKQSRRPGNTTNKDEERRGPQSQTRSENLNRSENRNECSVLRMTAQMSKATPRLMRDFGALVGNSQLNAGHISSFKEIPFSPIISECMFNMNVNERIRFDNQNPSNPVLIEPTNNKSDQWFV